MSVILNKLCILSFVGISKDVLTDFKKISDKRNQHQAKDNIGNQFPEIIKF